MPISIPIFIYVLLKGAYHSLIEHFYLPQKQLFVHSPYPPTPGKLNFSYKLAHFENHK